jgi:hypothetical protein
VAKFDQKDETTMTIYASFYIKKAKEKMRFTQARSLMFSKLRGFCKSLICKNLGDFYFQNPLQTGSE